MPLSVRFLAIALIALAGGPMTAPSLWADLSDIPNENHFKSLQKAQTCLSYRKLVRTTERELLVAQRGASEFMDALKEAKGKLDHCATQHGLHGASSQQWDEVALAELCETQYQAWLAPGYRLKMAQQDVESARSTLEHAKTLMQSSCVSKPAP